MKTIPDPTIAEARAAEICRALGNPVRMRIVLELARRSSCVTGHLKHTLPVAPTTLWQHLQVLKEAGIIRGAVDGEPNYCLEPGVLRWLSAFCLETAESSENALPMVDRCC